MGTTAARFGVMSEEVEALADDLGTNLPDAANLMYHAARLLRDEAHAKAAAHNQ